MSRAKRPDDEPAIPIRPHEGGYSVEGPGFYVWDQDYEEVRRVARALLRGEFDVRPSSRLLVVPPPQSN